MALTRRQFMAAVPACAVAACAHTGPDPHGRVARPKVLYESAGTAGEGSVLVCMPETPQTKEVWQGLLDEVSGEMALRAIRIDGRRSGEVIANAIQQFHPNALILMNNPTVASYNEYLSRADAIHNLPVVVVMSSFIEPGQLARMGAVGISYEVPLITVVTNLRRIIASPVERVGVVYRSPFTSFMLKQRELARREQIRVSHAVVSADPNASELRYAIRSIKGKSDAIWVLNDDRLLTPQLISHGWLPGLNEKPWRPTIVGAASLVSASQSLGTFAVLPDHTALGVQTANLVFEIADNDWQVKTKGTTELPLSTTTTIDLVQVRERFNLRDGALAQVDRVIE